MTKEEAHSALDRAVADYATTVFDDEGSVGMVKWVLVAHVDILSTNESGYAQAVSDNLALHERVGLLRYAEIHAETSVIAFGSDEED